MVPVCMWSEKKKKNAPDYKELDLKFSILIYESPQ
jgi:hypothetical protein